MLMFCIYLKFVYISKIVSFQNPFDLILLADLLLQNITVLLISRRHFVSKTTKYISRSRWMNGEDSLMMKGLSCVQTERKGTRKWKISLMFAVYSLLFFACSLIFYRFCFRFRLVWIGPYKRLSDVILRKRS